MGELETLLEATKRLDKQDKQKLIRQLSQPTPDEWTFGGRDERYLAYKAYSSDIANLIAKIEVYAHDLPPYVGALIEYLWHMLAVAAVENDPEAQGQIYKAIGKYTIHIKNELKIMLVDLYLDTIRGYRKTLGSFNHKVFQNANGVPVMQEVSSSIKQIRSLRRKAKRTRKTHFATFVDNGVSSIVVNCEKVCEIKEIVSAIEIAEKTIALCEENYAGIVNNGYSASFSKKVLAAIPDIVSFGLAVYGLLVLVQTIFPAILPK